MKKRSRLLAMILAGTMLASLLAGCGGKAPEVPATAETGEQKEQQSQEQQPAADVDTAEKEAPMLAEKVAAGELPALEERLPVLMISWLSRMCYPLANMEGVFPYVWAIMPAGISDPTQNRICSALNRIIPVKWKPMCVNRILTMRIIRSGRSKCVKA